jgi:transcriptional regulator with XRE-family HTH domain
VNVGLAINHRRVALGLGLKRFSRAVGMEPFYITKLESGAMSMRLTTLVRLAAALKCEPWELLKQAVTVQGPRMRVAQPRARDIVAVPRTPRLPQDEQRPIKIRPGRCSSCGIRIAEGTHCSTHQHGAAESPRADAWRSPGRGFGT